MKKVLQIFTLVCLSLTLTHCSDDDNSGDSPTEAQLTVSVNGVQFEATAIVAALGNDNKYFELDSANGNTSEGLQLRIGDFSEASAPVLEAGMTYNYTGANDTDIFYQNSQSVFGGTNGCQITIASIDLDNNTISGTFSGVVSDGADDQTLANGQFNNIPFTVN
ncbi:DUF6252 family protein [Psychroserpens algicola]|uniref:Lipoprotein n=1 Tax=Psychroserpens algicola TaxID=1719034 RepID=A0ABT0HAR5_9FLAO|nr:DUF6252 family protein [Psychroserpens algicola]MCK8480937.1 hypothetical protein [Psychroserpens algicola]